MTDTWGRDMRIYDMELYGIISAQGCTVTVAKPYEVLKLLTFFECDGTNSAIGQLRTISEGLDSNHTSTPEKTGTCYAGSLRPEESLDSTLEGTAKGKPCPPPYTCVFVGMVESRLVTREGSALESHRRVASA